MQKSYCDVWNVFEHFLDHEKYKFMNSLFLKKLLNFDLLIYCTNPALLFMDQCSVVHVLLEFILENIEGWNENQHFPLQCLILTYIFLWFYCRNVGEWNWGSCWSWQPSGLFYRRNCTIACGNLRQGLLNNWTSRHNSSEITIFCNHMSMKNQNELL